MWSAQEAGKSHQPHLLCLHARVEALTGRPPPARSGVPGRSAAPLPPNAGFARQQHGAGRQLPPYSPSRLQAHPPNAQGRQAGLWLNPAVPLVAPALLSFRQALPDVGSPPQLIPCSCSGLAHQSPRLADQAHQLQQLLPTHSPAIPAGQTCQCQHPCPKLSSAWTLTPLPIQPGWKSPRHPAAPLSLRLPLQPPRPVKPQAHLGLAGTALHPLYCRGACGECSEWAQAQQADSSP
mmetsp:Transcript_123928/g.264257  ORF Transcript_123928/g.264257 Transcript_123928/m.264257 type:complete len:236 (+) Transcript_123928:423-1130(+)